MLRIPPPLNYGAAFAAGMVLHAATVPLSIGARPEIAVLGAACLAAGTLLALAGSWWPLVTLPVVVLAVHRIVIGPEERYLAARFGRVYADYRARVRRWL